PPTRPSWRIPTCPRNATCWRNSGKQRISGTRAACRDPAKSAWISTCSRRGRSTRRCARSSARPEVSVSHSDLATIREYVAGVLRPRLPDGWKLSDTIPTIDRKLARPLVWLEYGEFSPLDGVPPAALAIAAQ